MSVATSPNAPSPIHPPFSIRLIVCVLLALIGIGMSAWAYQVNGSGPILTWGILPGAPFVILAGLSLVKRIPLRVTIGAYVGGVMAVAVPYGAIWYDLQNYNGGGANIGLGLLALAVFIILPIPMLIGGVIGWLVPTRTQEHLDKSP